MSTITDLIEKFAHSPMNIRLDITKQVLSYGQAAVPELVQGLKHPIWSVRQDCANALAELADPSAVQPLIEALKDKETGVRYEAARALGRIGTPEAKQAISALAHDAHDPDFRYFLYDCLDGKA